MAPGVRGSSKNHHPAPKTNHRGGIRKRSPQPRVEKDGDLVMDGASETRGRPSQSTRRGHGARGPSRNSGVSTQNIARAIGRSLNDSRNVNVRDAPRGPRRNTSPQQRFDNYDQIVVRGWKQSEAARNSDQGIPQLISFIDRKASKTDHLKLIHESQIRGDNLFIYTKPEDREKILRLNNFQFARGTLSVELKREGTVSAKDIKSAIKSMITRRHNEAEKYLDLSALGSDPELVELGMFETEERALKVFTVIMTVCESIWPSNFKRNQAVQSISLSKNNLTSVKNISILSQTFSKILNLDLSDNQIADHKALEPWSRKFRLLDHLILKGNAIETIPDFHLEIMKWFPKLRTLDTVQVRNDDQIAKTMNKIPVAPEINRGDYDISDSFIAQYFPAFDADRTAAVTTFYSEATIFSVNVKTSSAGNYKSDPWGKWIGMSRNLQKITGLNGRDQRCFAGLQAIDKCFSDMPKTKHPDIATERGKWLVECQSVQGLPDPTGQSPTGVNGLIIDVHGEFYEVGPNGENTAHRSFDRNFVLGPGETPGSVKIMKEMLTLRPYSGHDRFKPTISPQMAPQAGADGAIPNIVLNNGADIPAGLVVPEGFAVQTPNKSPEQLQQELVALELCKASRMTLEYSVQCLQETNWNLENASAAFHANKDKLPTTAFF